MIKRKNCPKCNRRPALMQTTDGVCGKTRMFFVECDRCRIRTFAHLTKKKAIEAWNGEKEIISEGGKFK